MIRFKYFSRREIPIIDGGVPYSDGKLGLYKLELMPS